LGTRPPGAWAAPGLELSASVASVTSPENPGGGGLDQRKWSTAARWASADEATYALVGWASTVWLRAGATIDVPGYRDASVLAEGRLRRWGVELVARGERTDRLEEERDVDPFRTVRPAPDIATLGVTHWTTLTAGVARPVTLGGRAAFRFSPFAEVSALAPSRVVAGATFDPVSFYGGRRLWALTAGVRLGAGVTHGRMGRYGVSTVPHATSSSTTAHHVR
jgi:hypothetical protein